MAGAGRRHATHATRHAHSPPASFSAAEPLGTSHSPFTDRLFYAPCSAYPFMYSSKRLDTAPH